jgi:hypothetical protein
LAIPAILAIQGVGCNQALKTFSILNKRGELDSMPKTNARKNTRNRSHAAKRERTRALRASLLAPAKGADKPAAKNKAKPAVSPR